MTDVITYHYVRRRTPARFPGLKVRSVDEFDDQLRSLATQPCGELSSVVDSLARGVAPAPDTYVLTFDDGFADHYTAVYPRLRARGITGAFFPIAGSSLHGELLDVHKVQLILATETDPTELQSMATSFLRGEGCPDMVRFLEPDVSHRTTGGRFDNPAVRSLKRALQAELPRALRGATVQHLFAETVGVDPRVVAAELYVDLVQLQEMAHEGMEVGGHSLTHHHLDTLNDAELDAELAASLEMLTAVYGETRNDWVFCYPYGSSNERVKTAVSSAGFIAALGVGEGAVVEASDIMDIPRFDTNKIARVPAAGPAS